MVEVADLGGTTILKGDRGREARTERGGVGQEVRRSSAGDRDVADEAHVGLVEVEERGRVAEGEAGELDERTVKNRQRRTRMVVADVGARADVTRRLTATQGELGEAAQQTVLGVRTGVEVQSNTRLEGSRVVERGVVQVVRAVPAPAEL